MSRLICQLIIGCTLLLLGACSDQGVVNFRINGISQLSLSNELLIGANVSSLDNFLIATKSNDTIHISTLTPSILGFENIDLRTFPKYIFGIDKKIPSGPYGKELTKSIEVHTGIYKTLSNRIITKGMLILYVANNETDAVVYITHKQIDDQITLIHLKSNKINKLVEIIEQGISYDGAK